MVIAAMLANGADVCSRKHLVVASDLESMIT